MLEKCFGNDTLTRSNVFRCHERFRSGRESVEDDERSGRPSTAKTDENINKIKGWMTVSRKLTIREIAELKTFWLMIWASDVSLQSWCRKTWISCKKGIALMSQDMLSKVDSDPSFIKRIITGDETWIYEYDTHSRHQASEWRSPNEPQPK